MTATFEDVILQSQPAFYPDGTKGAAGTAGMSWRWALESPLGLEADWTGVEFTCEILSRDDSNLVVLDLTMEADEANRIIVSATATQTEILDAPVIKNYPWRAFAVKGEDRVALWTAPTSEFTVFPSGYEEGS